jgi:hypothetical protein
MVDKKTTGRIIDGMNETMRGLHLRGAITNRDLEKFKTLLETKRSVPRTSRKLKIPNF